MRLLEAINPKTFYKTLIRVFRNVSNLKFYRKQLKQLQADGSLKQHGMRLDKRFRAYYVLNLEPETLLMGEEVLELERSRVYESLSKKKPLFEKAQLGELIEAKTERIKTSDYYAYLIQIKYRPISNGYDISYLTIWLAAMITAVYYLVQLAYQYQVIIDWFSNIMTAK